MRTSVDIAAGRSLDVFVDGPDEGTPLLFHHGTPGARVAFPQLVDEAISRGVRWISYTRPGYGGSTRDEGRDVARCAGDAVALLDRLGVRRCYVAGWSGGGPHALACAALAPDRVVAAATIASVAPYPAPGIDWLAGMGQENVEEFTRALEGAAALGPSLERLAADLRSVTGEDIVAAMGGLLSPVDQAALTGALGDVLAANFREALGGGIWGWLDDDLAFTRPWGFDLARIRVPVAVWQGRHDRMVPFAHGEWLARRVGHSRARLEPDAGHLSLAVGSFGRVLDDLLRM